MRAKKREVIVLNSSSDEEGAHPADQLIIEKAKKLKKEKKGKHAEGRGSPERKKAPKKGTKRKRSPDAMSMSEDEDPEVADVGNGAPRSGADGEPEPAPAPRKFKAPVGVTLIGDDEEVVEVGMQRTLRRDRYFTKDAFQDSAKKCFNCGKSGHFSRDCTNARHERPCTLCAKYGHSDGRCPAYQGLAKVRCYKCNRMGHVSRECPYPVGLAVPMLCQRCGDPNCASSGQPDWVRAEGGCSKGYAAEDMADIRCLSCHQLGHLNCKPVTAQPAHPSCYNCGQDGHLGPECTRQANYAVMSEKMEASNANGLKELRKEDDRGRASKKARWEVPPKAAASYWQAEDSSVEVRGVGPKATAFTYQTAATRYAAAPVGQPPPQYNQHAVPPPHYPTYSHPMGAYQAQQAPNPYQMYQPPPVAYPQNGFAQSLPLGGFTMGYGAPQTRQPQRHGNGETNFPRNRNRR